MSTGALAPPGINPTFWGAIFWRTLHAISFRVNGSEGPGLADWTEELIRRFIALLPCCLCRDKATWFVSSYSYSEVSRMALSVQRELASRRGSGTGASSRPALDLRPSQYCFVFHNSVNQELGKPYFDWGDCVRTYSHLDDASFYLVYLQFLTISFDHFQSDKRFTKLRQFLAHLDDGVHRSFLALPRLAEMHAKAKQRYPRLYLGLMEPYLAVGRMPSKGPRSHKDDCSSRSSVQDAKAVYRQLLRLYH